ncbi:MAG: hypothetical protein JOZ69_23165 [Myxococcales bacterium]|nr:hypothetical protein [Myxococcales bacterium]
MWQGSQRALDKTREAARNRFTFLLLLSLGIVLEIFPSLLRESALTRVLAGAGGVLLGSGLSLLISGLFLPDPFRRVFETLDVVTQAPWRQSAEDHVAIYRRRFHGYLHTKHKGKWVWLYRIFDFSMSNAPGTLHASVRYKTSGQRDAWYEYYGFVSRERLVFIGLNGNDPQEPAVIQVFPDHAFDGIHAGFAFVKTPNDGNISTVSLMTDYELLSGQEPGLLPDDHHELLFRTWKEASQNRLPRGLGEGEQISSSPASARTRTAATGAGASGAAKLDPA